MSDVMLCKSLKENCFKGMDLNGYLGEEKYDGSRLIAIKEGDKVELVNRRGVDKTKIFPEITNDLERLEGTFILDGEIIAENGKFNDLLKRDLLKDLEKVEIRKKEIPVKYVVFDLLKCEGEKLINKPLMSRKAILEGFREAGLTYVEVIRYVEGLDIKKLWKSVQKADKEGLVLKRKDSKYKFKRSDNWLKLKTWKETIEVFDNYQINNAGVKIWNDIVEIQVQDNGTGRVEEVIETIESGGDISCEVSYLSKNKKTNKLRMPTLKRVLK